MRLAVRVWLVINVLCACMLAQNIHVTGRVRIASKKGAVKDASGVVVWLTPRSGVVPPLPSKQYRLVQQDKHFEPHLLIVPVGANVEFPNRDPFFHNVFSVYEGTPFDLGLYESGSSKLVRFNRPGPSYIFCNIHPEMSAVILALKTPYFAMTNARGEYAIDVPPGDFELGVWYERTRADELKALSRHTTVAAGSAELGPIDLTESPSLAEGHKNKYGQSYEPDSHYPVH